MSLINKIISSLSFLCVFGCSNNDEEQDRKDLLKWINYQLIEIVTEIEADISKEKRGYYPHPGKADYQSKGFIDLVLKEKNGKRLNISRHSLLTLADIQNTEGYKQLLAKAIELKAQVSIKEVLIDGDEVDTMEELDEYIDDIYHYIVITLYGWQGEHEIQSLEI